MLLTPSYLKKGDLVYILSTARFISEEDILPSVSMLEGWGFRVEVGKTIGIAYHQYAGTDEVRRKDFQHAISEPQVKAIFCARGGYGTVRIMDQIDFSPFLRHPKWLIGFSDVTYLHTLINHSLGVKTIHAAMGSTVPSSTQAAKDSLFAVLTGEKTRYEFAAHPLNRMGRASGIVVGGNLSILHSLTGTRTVMDFHRKILLIEDVDEYLYHIDRMMWNLKRSNKLRHLEALVCGFFSDIKDNPIPFGKMAEEIIAEQVSSFSYPLCFQFPAGHIAHNCAVVLGGNYELRVEKDKSVFSQQ
jgi:muramoyltetrapeptide carboxypeptidase